MKSVRHKLDTQSLMDASNVSIRSVNQIIYLEGSVDGDVLALQDMVLNVRGVMGVNSNVVEDHKET